MKLFSRFLIYIFLSTSVIKSAAQTHNLKFNLVSGTDGITLGKINGLTRDMHGVMWFSDQTNRCIVRYDGTHMIKYQNDPKNPNSLGGTYPESIVADSTGMIWIGFYGGTGLDKFDPVKGNFAHYRHNTNDASSLASDTVAALLVDHYVWI